MWLTWPGARSQIAFVDATFKIRHQIYKFLQLFLFGFSKAKWFAFKRSLFMSSASSHFLLMLNNANIAIHQINEKQYWYSLDLKTKLFTCRKTQWIDLLHYVHCWLYFSLQLFSLTTAVCSVCAAFWSLYTFLSGRMQNFCVHTCTFLYIYMYL